MFLLRWNRSSNRHLMGIMCAFSPTVKQAQGRHLQWMGQTALKELFNQASLNNSRSLTFSMSMLEVYMGNLRDLLVPKSSCRAYGALTRCNQKAFGQQESTMHGPLTHANTRTAAHAAVNTAGRSFGSFTHAHAHSHDAITHTCCSKEICRIRTSMGPRHHSHEAHAALNKALTALTCSSFGKQPTHTRCTAANSDSTHAIRTASF
ncbi:hypothetical protein I3843_02G050800 [Carya illinoinensis]|nr:hypothetical protein I3843_02G050800 [Carya illinoinensis]